MKVQTRDQVRQRFRAEGRTLADWAREHGYTPNKVYRVMGGFDKGYYGESHKIAVQLGLKANVHSTAEAA
ncbi:MAG: DNA-binding protein [Burkholderiaceae bacterium]|nr:MAG: DNA-binding protein [Burkholderiaceae bacterium]